jgi:predicted peptidase
MARNFIIAGIAALGLMSCGGAKEPAVVENVVAYTKVADVGGLMVNAVEITVSNPKSLRGLKAEDFDITNNVADGFVDAVTGAALEPYADDSIVVSRDKNTLRIEAKPFNANGMRGRDWKSVPWELVCKADSNLNVTMADVKEKRIQVLDDCIKGSFTYAGITREYILHLPKDADGNVINNAPLLVWQIGGGEYNRDLMTAVMANRCVVSLPEAGVPCATLMFAIANPNYSYSASLDPERIKLVDRNNALQMAFIDTLIKEGKVDGSKLFCAGASSGGGCTMRFMMQFPDRFKAAIPCCAMDPIVPIHMVKEKYDGQFTDDLVKAFQDKVYKWNGSDMVLEDMDTKAFCNLPMFFVHAESDRTCKVISSHAYFNARKRLGAQNDKIEIYDDAYMQKYGIPTMISHFSWVPLLNDYSEGKAMDWLVKQM